MILIRKREVEVVVQGGVHVPKKNRLKISIKNAFKDEGNGKISFRNGLTITDNGEQLNGTKYDIKSMDLSGYDGMLTADHSMNIDKIIGKTSGVRKVANKRVIVESIQFAIKENALAQFAYDMIKAKFLNAFSIETIGPWPDDDGVYKDSKLVGLSAVVTGNNKSATVNSIVESSIAESKRLGLDTSVVEDNFLCYDKNNNSKKEIEMKFKTIKNSRTFAVTVKYTNAAGDECETEVKPGETVDVAEDQADDVQGQVDDAKEPEVEGDKEETKEETKESVADAVKSAIEPLMKQVEALKKDVFNSGASEPKFTKAKNGVKLTDMDHEQILDKQINGYLDFVKRGSQKGLQVLSDCNEINLERLKEAELVKNVMTLADFGNFVIPPEMLTEIQGYRTNFQSILSKFAFKETLSQQMAWLERNGDIDMTSVEFCDDGADGNLKPISEYTAEQRTANLEELAAVTPVCNAATRFLAVDMIQDVTQGYRLDYDRKKSQLIIARLQQAVNFTGFKNPYDGTSATTRLTSFVDTLARVSENVEGGSWIMNEKSRLEIVRRAIEAGISGPLAMSLQSGDMTPLLGKNYMIVPNELLPSLNTAETKTFVVDGANVTIDQSVFYTEPQWFKGRISGGLQFDLSTEAAYEVSGVVKSAFQRNELVLRGSFFRNGAITDRTRVTSMYAAGVS